MTKTKYLLFALLLSCTMAIKAQVPGRLVITDLPPLISQTLPAIDVFVDSAAVDRTILLVCKQFSATCAVAGDSEDKIGYVCSGDSRACWRRFISVLVGAGVVVSISPGVGGASFGFVLKGDNGAGDFIEENN